MVRIYGPRRDESRADSVPVRERCQTDDVSTQQAPEGMRFGVAEFGKLSRCIDNGTVVLTQLGSVSSEWFNGRREPLLGQPFSDLVDSGDGRRGRSHAGQETVCTVRGELCYRCASIPLR